MTDQATLPPPSVVTGPGVYSIPVADYHARPELSSTGARKLLPPSCPALFRYWRDEGEEPKQAWDIGSAAHKLVLGIGPKLVLVDKARWDTNDVKTRLAEIRAAGNIPLKREPYDAVHAMAGKLREHPIAGALFTPRGTPDASTGEAEVTVIWRDDQTAVMCRALIDWLPYFTLHRDGRPATAPAYPGRLLVPDYKTTGREHGASPDGIGKAMAEHGYYVQMAWYLMGLRAVGYAREDTEALLVFQETRPPYLVTVSQPDATAMRLGAIRIREAIDVYAECTATGRWPGYAEDVVLAELPPWETRELRGEVW